MNNSQSEANKEEEAVDALAAQAETQTATLHGTVAVPVVGQPANQAGKRTNHTRMDNENMLRWELADLGELRPWRRSHMRQTGGDHQEGRAV